MEINEPAMNEFYHGEKGFTLIELLLIIAILALLAGIVVPQLAGFLTAGKVAAANTEVASVESAALAYYAEHGEQYPPNPEGSDVLDDEGYLNEKATVRYTFDEYGRVEYQDNAIWGDHSDVIWNDTAHQWQSIRE
jgi:prepilin-type N-terminal cleavage/methylation domain-containing protein